MNCPAGHIFPMRHEENSLVCPPHEKLTGLPPIESRVHRQLLGLENTLENLAADGPHRIGAHPGEHAFAGHAAMAAVGGTPNVRKMLPSTAEQPALLLAGSAPEGTAITGIEVRQVERKCFETRTGAVGGVVSVGKAERVGARAYPFTSPRGAWLSSASSRHKGLTSVSFSQQSLP